MLERALTPARRHTLAAAIGIVVLTGLMVGGAQAAHAVPLTPAPAVPGTTASTDVHEAAELALESANQAMWDAGVLAAEVTASALSLPDTLVDTDELAENASWLASAHVVPNPLLHEFTQRTLTETARVESRLADVRERLTVAEEERSAELAAAEAARLKAEEERIAAERARIAAEQAAAALAAANTVEGAKATAAAMASSEYGWGADEFSCLDSLWQRESNWNYEAYNASSGATGIPQALPGSKMASAGDDWQTNAATQIAWGLGYIAAVYGTPCGAWGHSQSVGWY